MGKYLRYHRHHGNGNYTQADAGNGKGQNDQGEHLGPLVSGAQVGEDGEGGKRQYIPGVRCDFPDLAAEGELATMPATIKALVKTNFRPL